MNKVIKVDRVCTIAEALELENLGVDIIGVTLNNTSVYPDNRVLNFECVSMISNVLTSTKLAIEVSYNCSNLFELIEEMKPSYIQISGTELIPIEQVKKLIEENVNLIYAGINASYQDDPSWILSRFIDSYSNVSFYQVDLLADIENSWEFFKSESHNYPEELQTADIVKLGEEFPLLVSLDFNKGNVFEIIEVFSSARGVVLTLSDVIDMNNRHSVSYESVIELLGLIHAKKTK